MSDYYSDLDACRAAGFEYAATEIAAGAQGMQVTPFGGQWDGMTGQDVLTAIGVARSFGDLDEFEQTDVVEAWEDGYNARWYEVACKWRAGRFTGEAFCETHGESYCQVSA